MSAIPKIVHQTWKTEFIPYEIYDRRWVTSWSRLQPDWLNVLWTDERLLQLGRACYPEYELMYRPEVPGIFLADFGRYMVLHRFGGLYVDLDYECLKPVEPLLRDRSFVTSYTNDVDRELNNALIATVPGHPLLARYMEACCRRWKIAEARGTLPEGPGWVTGPVMMTEETQSYLAEGGASIAVHESRLLCPIDWRKGLSIHRNTLPTDVIARVRADYPDAYAATYWTHNH